MIWLIMMKRSTIKLMMQGWFGIYDVSVIAASVIKVVKRFIWMVLLDKDKLIFKLGYENQSSVWL